MSRPNWQVRCWGWRRAYAFRGGLSVDWCSARFPRRLQRSRRRPPPLAAAPLAAPPAGCCLPPAGANLAVPVPVCPAAKYESEAGRYWDLFYKRNEVRGRAAKVAGVCLVGSWCLGTCGLQADGLLPDLPRSFFRPVPFTLVIPASIYIQDRFFKDRHYFGREWPQLLSAQHVLEVGPSPGRLLTSRACRKDGRQLATARRVLEAVPQLMRRFFCSPPAAHALVHRPLSLPPPPPPRTCTAQVGCGVGNSIYPLLQLNPGVHVYACDFAPSAVALVRAHPGFSSRRVTAFVADITQGVGQTA